MRRCSKSRPLGLWALWACSTQLLRRTAQRRATAALGGRGCCAPAAGCALSGISRVAHAKRRRTDALSRLSDGRAPTTRARSYSAMALRALQLACVLCAIATASGCVPHWAAAARAKLGTQNSGWRGRLLAGHPRAFPPPARIRHAAVRCSSRGPITPAALLSFYIHSLARSLAKETLRAPRRRTLGESSRSLLQANFKCVTRRRVGALCHTSLTLAFVCARQPLAMTVPWCPMASTQPLPATHTIRALVALILPNAAAPAIIVM